MISQRIVHIREEIESVCNTVGRDSKEVVLVGVTKFADVDQIDEAITSGLQDIGENKVQVAQEKFSLLKRRDFVTKHMIGHLQTNKVKQSLQLFDLIQSVDSFKLAQAIENQAQNLNIQAKILIQIDTAQEEQKFGLALEGVQDLFEKLSNFKNVRTLGLMTMAPFIEDENRIRECFKIQKKMFDELASQYSHSETIQMKYCSMGMTADYKIAIEEGSNMVRVGRAIFTH